MKPIGNCRTYPKKFIASSSWFLGCWLGQYNTLRNLYRTGQTSPNSELQVSKYPSNLRSCCRCTREMVKEPLVIYLGLVIPKSGTAAEANTQVSIWQLWTNQNISSWNWKKHYLGNNIFFFNPFPVFRSSSDSSAYFIFSFFNIVTKFMRIESCFLSYAVRKVANWAGSKTG